jgi:hypothetical protein
MKSFSIAAAVFLFSVSTWAQTWTTPQLNGGTDDTAIQAAVDTGLDVYFAEGVYLLDDTVTITAKTGQVLWGPGTLKLASGRPLGTAFFDVTGANKVTFRYLTFDGQKELQTQPPENLAWNSGAPRAYFTPINIEDSKNITVDQCEFFDICTTSINFARSTYTTITRNYCHDSYMDCVFTNDPEGNSYATLHRNRAENIHYDLVAYGNCYLTNVDHVVHSWNTADGCDRSGVKAVDRNRIDILVEYGTYLNSNQGINVQGGTDIVLDNNTIGNISDMGITATGRTDIDTSIQNLTITNNYIYNIGTDPLAGNRDGISIIRKTDNTIIDSNTLLNGTRMGIRLFAPTDTFIGKNTIKGWAFDGVTLSGSEGENADEVVITLNLFENIERYGISSFYSPTNVTIAGDNTFINIGVQDIWP